MELPLVELQILAESMMQQSSNERSHTLLNEHTIFIEKKSGQTFQTGKFYQVGILGP
jgi:uncharacterized protein YpbB